MDHATCREIETMDYETFVEVASLPTLVKVALGDFDRES